MSMFEDLAWTLWTVFWGLVIGIPLLVLMAYIQPILDNWRKKDECD